MSARVTVPLKLSLRLEPPVSVTVTRTWEPPPPPKPPATTEVTVLLLASVELPLLTRVSLRVFVWLALADQSVSNLSSDIENRFDTRDLLEIFLLIGLMLPRAGTSRPRVAELHPLPVSSFDFSDGNLGDAADRIPVIVFPMVVCRRHLEGWDCFRCPGVSKHSGGTTTNVGGGIALEQRDQQGRNPFTVARNELDSPPTHARRAHLDYSLSNSRWRR